MNLSAKNPNKNDEVELRRFEEVTTEIVESDNKSKDILNKIGDFL